MDDGWVLLTEGFESKHSQQPSPRFEIKHSRQPSQATMRSARVGRKVLKYFRKVGAKVREQPEFIASLQPTQHGCPELDASLPRAIPCPLAHGDEGDAQHATSTETPVLASLSSDIARYRPTASKEEIVDSFVHVSTMLATEAAVLHESDGMRQRHSSSMEAPVLPSLSSAIAKYGPTAPKEETADSFVHVSTTPATEARRFERQHPRAARGVLWLWFVLLILGELATTIWWLYCIGARGLVVLGAPAGLGLSLGLLAFGPEQMIVIAVAVSAAAMPAMPAYSAVLLMMPPMSSTDQLGTCWDTLHWPMLILLGVTYLTTAWVPAVRAELAKPTRSPLAHAALQSLETAQKLTWSACVASAWLYVAIVLHVAATHLPTGRQQPIGTNLFWHFAGGALSDPLFKGRGFILTLHAVGLLCTAARQCTIKQLGANLLPRLLGRERARELTPRVLAMHYGPKILKRVPELKRLVPAKAVVALVIAVRRTAIVLFPMLAVLPQLARPDAYCWPVLPFLLGFVMIAVLAKATAHEHRALPNSSLRRLPLLLPSGIAPCTRKVLGYALVAAEGVEKTRSGLTFVCSRLKRVGNRHKSQPLTSIGQSRSSHQKLQPTS